MSRTATKTQEPVTDVVLNQNAVTVIEQTQDALAIEDQQMQVRVRAVALQVGYQLPGDCIDPDLIQRDIAANMRRSVEACLEVGRGLTALKAACQHGSFMSRLDVLGLESRVAQRFMQAAAKFSNAALTTHLTKAIRAIVDRAFSKDTKGQLKTAAVLDLMRLDIDDAEWKRAMEAIRDSIQTTGTAIYVRVYERIGDSDQYKAIPLDLAAV